METVASLLGCSSDRKGIERAYRLAAAAVLCLGLSLRLIGLDKDIGVEEAYVLKVALSQNLSPELVLAHHPPLFYFFFWLWSKMGSGDAFMRLPSVLFGIGTVAVLMKWIKPYSHLGSLLAGLYCATLPMMLLYSQEIRGYSLLLFASTLAFYFASQLVREPERLSSYVGLGLSLAVAVATHTVGVLLLMSVCAFAASRQSTWRRFHLAGAGLALGVPLCVFALQFVLFPHTSRDASTWWMPDISRSLFLYTSRSLLGISQVRWPFWLVKNIFPVLEDTIVDLLRRDLDAIIMYSLVLLSFTFGNWRRTFPFLAAAIAYWGQMVVCSVIVIPIVMPRTALPGILPFIAFVGLQITTVRLRKLRIVLVAGLVLLCLVFAVNWIGKEAGKPIERWTEIVALLESTRQPDDVVILYPEFYITTGLGHYVDLSSTRVVGVSFWSSLNAVDGEIRGLLAEMKSKADSSAVFVISVDVTWCKGYQGHDRLLKTLLQSQLGEPVLSVELGELTLLKYEYHKP